MIYPYSSVLLDAFVLSIAAEGDTYGYLIAQRLKPMVSLKDSTLYPVLRRLLEAGYLETYDQPFQGRNRRYYHITPAGLARQSFYVEEWHEYRKNVEGILMGGNEL